MDHSPNAPLCPSSLILPRCVCLTSFTDWTLQRPSHTRRILATDNQISHSVLCPQLDFALWRYIYTRFVGYCYYRLACGFSLDLLKYLSFPIARLSAHNKLVQFDWQTGTFNRVHNPLIHWRRDSNHSVQCLKLEGFDTAAASGHFHKFACTVQLGETRHK